MDALAIALFVVVVIVAIGAALQYRRHHNYVVAVERFWVNRDQALDEARNQAAKHFSKQRSALKRRDWALQLADKQLGLANSESAAGVSLLKDADSISKR